MKKIITSVAIAILCLSNGANAQTCTPDTSIHTPGMYPAALPHATQGNAYVTSIQIRVLTDTTTTACPFGSTVTVNYIQLDSVHGVPTGFAYSYNPSNGHMLAGSNGCVSVYSTGVVTNPIGTYPLTVYYTTNVTVPACATTTNVPGTNTTYSIIVDASAGIEATTSTNYGFQVMQNNPNPVVGSNTAVKFTTPADGKVKMSVYNVTGQKIAEKEFSAQRGDNSYDFDATTLENGIYLYSIEYNGQKQVRRMVVAK